MNSNKFLYHPFHKEPFFTFADLEIDPFGLSAKALLNFYSLLNIQGILD